MISKNRRVTKGLFDSVIKEGYVIHSPLFTLRYKAFSEKDTYKLAFVAPKSIAKLANKRNTLRRQGYRAISDINVKKGFIYIVFYKKQVKEATYQQIKDDLSSLFLKIKA
jgi:ribonuclease P protein component